MYVARQCRSRLALFVSYVFSVASIAGAIALLLSLKSQVIFRLPLHCRQAIHSIMVHSAAPYVSQLACIATSCAHDKGIVVSILMECHLDACLAGEWGPVAGRGLCHTELSDCGQWPGQLVLQGLRHQRLFIHVVGTWLLYSYNTPGYLSKNDAWQQQSACCRKRLARP
jgi:hypothetical protein